MRINKNQLHRFKKVKKGYLYPISRGIYLSFNYSRVIICDFVLNVEKN
jgi:hypothetical protein